MLLPPAVTLRPPTCAVPFPLPLTDPATLNARQSALLGLALDGSKLDGVVLKRTNGSLA